MRASRRAFLACLMASVAALPAPPALARPQETKSAQIPVANGTAGPCSAEFTVTDTAKKPLYDAKVRVLLKYGFARKLELEVGTNSDGKARFEGLPAKIKKPAAFEVRHGSWTKSLPYSPAGNCQARYDVTLGEK